MELPFDLRIQDRIAVLTLSRPDTLNSLTFEVYRELVAFFETAPRDDRFDVVVVTGTGRGFCSGGDVHEIIGELFERDMKGLLEFTRMTGDLVKAIRLVDKPVIAAINGLAAGAGSVIALACDLRVMAETAAFRFLFTHVGLTGADMGANKVVPEGKALEAAMEWAERLATGPRLAIAMTKRMIQNEMNMDIVSAIEAEAQAQALMLQGRDHRAFYEAFKEKRKPRFTGE